MMNAVYAAPRMRVAIHSAEKKTDTNMRRAALITGYQKLKRRMKHDRCDDHFVDQILTNVTDRHLCGHKKITRQVYACRVFLYTGIFKCCSKTISEDNGLDLSVVDHNVINNTDNESL